MIVPRVRTPVPLSTLLDALDAAGHEVLASCPGVDRLAVAWAQLALEHGVDPPQVGHDRMLRGLFNYNFGNRDASAAEIADPGISVFETVAEREVINGVETTRVHHRRAYPTAHAGLVAWWEAMRTRWIDAFEVMEDTRAFAIALREAGYYTASAEAYAAALVPLAAQARGIWQGA